MTGYTDLRGCDEGPVGGTGDQPAVKVAVLMGRDALTGRFAS